MLRYSLIGNLGADAEVVNYNGKIFLSFQVADTRRYTDVDGAVKEDTQWVQCTWNNFNESLVPFLVKGRCVCVLGRGSSRAYSSKKLRAFTSQPIMFVDHLELVGTPPAVVPRRLYTEDGALIDVLTFYTISQDAFKSFKLKKGESVTLLSADQRRFVLDERGIVTPEATNDNVDNQ